MRIQRVTYHYEDDVDSVSITITGSEDADVDLSDAMEAVDDNVTVEYGYFVLQASMDG